jgi:capsid protein
MAGIPVLILEVNSDANHSDQYRMFLQGSCIVRLGNSLRKSESPPFMVKAIYIDENYRALEYTLYESKPAAEVSQ